MVFPECVEQHSLAVGVGCRAQIVPVCTGHFHIPDGGFPEGVVAPVPAVFFENFDEVAQIIRRPRCPDGGGEFTDVT